MVDLDSSFAINNIEIHNRIDCCMDRLGDYTVSILDNNRNAVWSSHQTTYPNPVTTINAAGKTGRYVKVQLTGVNYLNLAEVKVNVNAVPPVGIRRTPIQSPPRTTITQDRISFCIASANNITLDIFSAPGKKLATLASGRFGAGDYSFGLRNRFMAMDLLICKLTIGSAVTTQAFVAGK